MRLQEGSNEIAGSRPISARVGQHPEVGLVERVENPSTPFLCGCYVTEFQGTFNSLLKVGR